MDEGFKDQIECYTEIARYARAGVPEPWLEIRIDVELDGEMIKTVSSYVPRTGTGKRGEFLLDSFGAECFYFLARLISTPKKGLFKTCRFTLHSDGRYNADFTY